MIRGSKSNDFASAARASSDRRLSLTARPDFGDMQAVNRRIPRILPLWSRVCKMVDAADLTQTRHRSGSMPHSFERCSLVIAMLLAFGTSVHAQVSPETPDIPSKFEA